MRRKREESGAALVEFALLLPVFMALILGMFSGGIAYNQKLDLTHATREGARYGATVAVTNQFANGQSWASNVRDLIIDRASGDLSGNVRRAICGTRMVRTMYAPTRPTCVTRPDVSTASAPFTGSCAPASS